MSTSIFTRRVTAAALLIFFACASTNAQTCYYPDGKTISTDIPCDPTGGDSSCCGAESFCLADGLCYGNGLVTRASCTDSTWTNGVCAGVCTDVDRSAEVALTPCTQTTTSITTSSLFACGANTTDCTTNTNTFTLSGSASLVLRPNQIAQLVGSAVQTTAPTNFANSAPTSTGEFTATTLVGVAVGVAAPLIIALIIMAFLLRREKRRFSKPRLMYKLPDEVTEEDFTFSPQAPAPVQRSLHSSPTPNFPTFSSNRSSQATGTSTIASRRASRHTLGSAFGPKQPLASLSFLERYETMKKNSQVQLSSREADGTFSPGPGGLRSPGLSSLGMNSPGPGPRHELESPSKEVLRYELSENRMSQ